MSSDYWKDYADDIMMAEKAAKEGLVRSQFGKLSGSIRFIYFPENGGVENINAKEYRERMADPSTRRSTAMELSFSVDIQEFSKRARDQGWEYNRRVRVGSADWRKTLVPSIENIYGKGSMDADRRGDTLSKMFGSYVRVEDVPQQPLKNDKHINEATGLPYNTIRIAEVFDSAESCYDAYVAQFGTESEQVATLAGEDANKVYELAATLLEAGVSSTDVTSTVTRKLGFSESQVKPLVNELID